MGKKCMGKRKPTEKWLGIFDQRTPHRKFEDDCEKYLKNKYPGYEIKPQHRSRTGKSSHWYKEEIYLVNITDFFGQNKKNPKKRLTAEAKHVKNLTKANVDQAANVYPRFPKEKLVIIPRNTTVSTRVKEYAKKRKVKIVRLKSDYH